MRIIERLGGPGADLGVEGYTKGRSDGEIAPAEVGGLPGESFTDHEYCELKEAGEVWYISPAGVRRASDR